MYRILIVEYDRGIAEAFQVQAGIWDLQVRWPSPPLALPR